MPKQPPPCKYNNRMEKQYRGYWQAPFPGLMYQPHWYTHHQYHPYLLPQPVIPVAKKQVSFIDLTSNSSSEESDGEEIYQQMKAIVDKHKREKACKKPAAITKPPPKLKPPPMTEPPVATKPQDGTNRLQYDYYDMKAAASLVQLLDGDV